MFSKKTVDSILAPFAKMKTELEELAADKQEAISDREVRILDLEEENRADLAVCERAETVAARIAAIGF